MNMTASEKLAALESEVKSLRGELGRVQARQQRSDDSMLKLIKAWQPFLLTVGESLVDLSRGPMRSSSLKRLRKGMAVIRGLLPAISDDDGQKRSQ
jgi:hypothetical protein